MPRARTTKATKATGKTVDQFQPKIKTKTKTITKATPGVLKLYAVKEDGGWTFFRHRTPGKTPKFKICTRRELSYYECAPSYRPIYEDMVWTKATDAYEVPWLGRLCSDGLETAFGRTFLEKETFDSLPNGTVMEVTVVLTGVKKPS